jgi:hypothetical protein
MSRRNEKTSRDLSLHVVGLHRVRVLRVLLLLRLLGLHWLHCLLLLVGVRLHRHLLLLVPAAAVSNLWGFPSQRTNVSSIHGPEASAHA